MIARLSQSWQLILADLALILFLLTLLELARDEAIGLARTQDHHDASQALFRPSDNGPTIAQWLAERPRDPRATLTIYALDDRSGSDALWAETRSLARHAAASGFRVRVVIVEGYARDLYASLAYDTPR